MIKIPFKNGAKSKNAYVTIDGTSHDVTDAVYTGETPLSAENLNKMQENIEESVVSVSSTEPTTNEKVWLRNTKNLFNKNSFESVNCQITEDTMSTNAQCDAVILPVEPSQTYTISRVTLGARFVVGFTEEYPANGVTVTSKIQNNTATSLTITGSSTSKYLVVWYYHSYYDTDKQAILDGLMVKYGSTAATYENYIESGIYTKNENGVYQKFYSDNDKVTKMSLDLITFENGVSILNNNNFPSSIIRKGNTVFISLWLTVPILSSTASTTILTIPEGWRPTFGVTPLSAYLSQYGGWGFGQPVLAKLDGNGVLTARAGTTPNSDYTTLVINQTCYIAN